MNYAGNPFSESSIKAATRIIDGHVVKYDEKIHIPHLIDIFSWGGDISTFCSKCEINRSTFFMWVKSHKKFKEAYEYAEELARDIWERMGQKGIQSTDFNSKQWAMVGRNRFGVPENRRIRIKGFKKAKTPSEQYSILSDQVESGTMTVDELNKMASFVSSGANILEKTELAYEMAKLKELIQG